MARTYKNAIKMRLKGTLHLNDMTLIEKIAFLIYLKGKIKIACKHDWGNTDFCKNCLSINDCPVK